MKVFISWSGERSKRVGLLLRSWLKCVLQAATPWMSDVDIDRGAAWFSEINKALDDCINGIICITKGNLNKPWLLFEAGALAKGLTSSRVCTFLIDLIPNDVGDPLSQFNHTQPTEDSMHKLVKTLNSRMGEYILSSEILDRVFKTYWPQFESEFKEIISNTTEDKLPARKEQDVMGDVLSTLRRLDRRITLFESNYEHEVYNNSNINLLSPIKNIREFKPNFDDVQQIICDCSSREDAINALCVRCKISKSLAIDLVNKFMNENRDNSMIV